MRDNYAAEVKTLTQHLVAHPESMVFARLADRYLHLHEVEKAVEICQRGLRNHPRYASAHYVLAKCYLARNQFDEAEKHLKQILFLDSHFLNAHKMYGDLMAKMGLTPRRRASLSAIHDLDPLFSMAVEDGGAEPPVPIAPAHKSVMAAPLAPAAKVEPEPEPEPLAPIWSAEEPAGPSAALSVPGIEPAAPVRPSDPFAPFISTKPGAAPAAGPQVAAGAGIERHSMPLSDYAPPLPELDLDEFARELEALEVPAGEEVQEKPVILSREIEPLAEAADATREPASDFEREETHFSEILDDLFSLSRDEEERREVEARHSLERAAMRPEPELRPVPPAAEARPDFSSSPRIIRPEEIPSAQKGSPEEQAPFAAPAAPPGSERKVVPPPQTLNKTEMPPLSERQKPPAPAAHPHAEREEPPTERRMSPVLPFRADEEWLEDPMFSAPPEPELPIRLEPPDVEPSPFLAREAEEQPAGSVSSIFPASADEEMEDHFISEDEEEQFADFLSNLDRMAGTTAGPDEEKEFEPHPDARLDHAWEEEPDGPIGPEKQAPAWEIPRRAAPASSPSPMTEEPDQAGDDAAEKPKEKFVTPTLGEIYAAQGQYAKAISVFEMLLKKNPENEWYRTKLDYLRKRLEEDKQ